MNTQFALRVALVDMVVGGLALQEDCLIHFTGSAATGTEAHGIWVVLFMLNFLILLRIYHFTMSVLSYRD